MWWRAATIIVVVEVRHRTRCVRYEASNRKKNESDTNPNKLFLDHVVEEAVVRIIFFLAMYLHRMPGGVCVVFYDVHENGENVFFFDVYVFNVHVMLRLGDSILSRGFFC